MESERVTEWVREVGQLLAGRRSRISGKPKATTIPETLQRKNQRGLLLIVKADTGRLATRSREESCWAVVGTTRTRKRRETRSGECLCALRESCFLARSKTNQLCKRGLLDALRLVRRMKGNCKCGWVKSSTRCSSWRCASLWKVCDF